MRRMRGTNKAAFSVTGVIDASCSSPAAGARSYAELKALDGAQEISMLGLPSSLLELRLLGDTEDSVIIQEIWLGRGQGHMLKAFTLSWTVGAQEADEAGFGLADALEVTKENWYKTPSVLSPGGDGVAAAVFDFMDCSDVIIITTTLPAENTCKLYYAPIFIG